MTKLPTIKQGDRKEFSDKDDACGDCIRQGGSGKGCAFKSYCIKKYGNAKAIR